MRRTLVVLLALGVCLAGATPGFAAKGKAKLKPKELLLTDPLPPLTEEDRALTEVAYAKGAPAVLLIEARQKQWWRLEFARNTYLRRTKILNQDGVSEWGDFTYYLPSTARIQKVRAKTILPDGTEVDCSDSVHQDRASSGYAAVHVSFQQVQIGAILELVINYNTDSWSVAPWVIQRQIPVLESRFIMIPPEGLRYRTVLLGLPPELNKPQAVRNAELDAFVWRFTDVEPLVREPNPPPEDDVAQQLFVILSSYETPNVYFAIADNWESWNKRRTEIWDEWLKTNDSRAKDLARSVVTERMGPLEKAEAVRLALRERVQVDWRDTWPIHDSPDEVLSKGSGNSADLAGTAVSMLRAVKVDADLASIRRRTDGAVPFQFPVPERFNDTIVRMKGPAGSVFFSPLVDAPVGSLHYEFSGILAFPYDKKTAEPVIIPDFTADQNRYVRTVQAELDESGSLHAKSTHTCSGVAASFWRSRLGDKSDEDIKEAVQDRLRELIDGAIVKSVRVELQEKSSGDLVLNCEWEAPGYATPAGKRLILNPRLFNRISVDDWAQDTRESPIHLRSAYETIDTFTFHYPEGVMAIELPQELKFEVKGVGVYEMRYRQEDRAVVAERKMRLDRYSFPPTAYPTLKKWMSKVGESDDSPVVLTLQ